jgi:hypothetical protein
MSAYDPQPVPQFTQVQLFSFGSNRCSIDSAIETLEALKEAGCKELEIASVNSADATFYGVKYRQETPDETLDRAGIKKPEDKRALLKLLKAELGSCF